MVWKKIPPKGQAIILVALMMVALIAILGLSLDGGGLYFLHRDTQNAVDSAAWTAAYVLCTGGDVQAAAEGVVESNGFGGSNLTVTTPYTPPDVELTEDFQPQDYVRVELTAEKPSFFIRLVYPGPLLVTSSAVGHCKKTVPPSISLAE